MTHDGKQLLFTLNLSDGLNATAMNNLFSFGYYDIAILMHESNISQSLNVSNIDLIDNSLMLYTTMPGLTAMDSFQVSGLILYSVHNISYNNSTSSYFLIDHPELLRQYYLYSCRNYFNAIAVPILFVILFLISLRIYGGY